MKCGFLSFPFSAGISCERSEAHDGTGNNNRRCQFDGWPNDDEVSVRNYPITQHPQLAFIHTAP